MKRSIKSMLGVTLLEILLILAIAALIIIMSVRYYQSASTTQQANSAFSQIQGITAAANTLAGLNNGSFEKVSTNTVKEHMPQKSLDSPWGTDITIEADGKTGYKVDFGATPPDVCTLIKPRIETDKEHYTYEDCLVYKYSSAPSGPST